MKNGLSCAKNKMGMLNTQVVETGAKVLHVVASQFSSFIPGYLQWDMLLHAMNCPIKMICTIP